VRRRERNSASLRPERLQASETKKNKVMYRIIESDKKDKGDYNMVPVFENGRWRRRIRFGLRSGVALQSLVVTSSDIVSIGVQLFNST
jgi:hypothetical protein